MAHQFANITAESTRADMAESAQRLFELVKRQLVYVFPEFVTLSWDQVGPSVPQYVMEHPGVSALQLASVLIKLAPGLVTMPALGASGFRSLGPTAGKCGHAT
jgi:hypothetical protein